MTVKLDWNDLLNKERKRKSTLNFNDHRNEFEKDYDRIVSSSSVRRLQDKAQVFPLQKNDYTRTRLTHSIEVSAIAKSFGRWLEKWLIKNNEIETYQLGYIPSILEVAGLVHDLGNPPFGHYGEDVIKNWFDNWFRRDSFKKISEKFHISEGEKNDFLRFDGNAQGIRILTKLQYLNDQFGINFTYGSLSSLLKYPWSSSNTKFIDTDKPKFGYFQKDKQIMKEVIHKTTKKEGIRNPLALLLEASDDIAYMAADVEDGVKKGVIDWNNEFPGICEKLKEHFNEEEINKLEKKHSKANDKGYPDLKLTSAQNFRVWAQGKMMKEVMHVFQNKYTEIMSGNFKGSLIKCSNKATIIKTILGNLQAQCFTCKEVLSLELVGDRVITDLLNVFVEAIVSDDGYNEEGDINTKSRKGKALSMISDNFVFVQKLNYETGNARKTLKELSLYERLLLVTDFISGMTDSYAVDLHQKLIGVKLL